MPLFTEKTSKLVDVPKGFHCDKCKQRFVFERYRTDDFNQISCTPEYVPVKHQFGYGSDCDQHSVDMTLCEPCFESLCGSMQLLPDQEGKPILYIDMDETLCDYFTPWHQAKKQKPDIAFSQSQTGFFLNLQPIDDAINAVNHLRKHYEVYVLTAPSYKNPHCYTEKRLWIEKYFDLEFTRQLIICEYKNLLSGQILIDDNVSGKGQEHFQGRLMQFGSEQYPNWAAILDALLPNTNEDVEAIVELATEIFGDQIKGLRWLETPLKTFKKRSPKDVWHTPEGRAEIMKVLRKIESGDFN